MLDGTKEEIIKLKSQLATAKREQIDTDFEEASTGNRYISHVLKLNQNLVFLVT